uniref:C2H2-type domain-containing protein n=1 Tax=Clastoptera arizonana TaxID=38151 RepID=A0A1B6D160_9HEMI
MESRYSFTKSDGLTIGTNSQEIDYSNIVLKQEEVDIEPDDYFEDHRSFVNNTSDFVKVENGSLDLMPTPRERLLSPTTSLIEISDDEEEEEVENRDNYDHNIQFKHDQCQSKPLNSLIEISVDDDNDVDDDVDDDGKDDEKDDKKDDDTVDDNIQDKNSNCGHKTPNINRCHKTSLQFLDRRIISLVPELAAYLYGDENIGNSEPEETTLINKKTSNSKLNNIAENVEESVETFHCKNCEISFIKKEDFQNHLETKFCVIKSTQEQDESNVTSSNKNSEKRKNLQDPSSSSIQPGSTSSKQENSFYFEEYCDICNYGTIKRPHFIRHLKSKRHVLLSRVEAMCNGSSTNDTLLKNTLKTTGTPPNSSSFKINQENNHSKIINNNHNTNSNYSIMPPECHIAAQEDSKNVIEEDDKSLILEDHSIKYKLVNLDGVTLFQCKICDSLSKQHIKMEKHIKMHTNSNKLKSNECEKKLRISNRAFISNKYKASCSKNEINHNQKSLSPNKKVDNQPVLDVGNKQITRDIKHSTNITPGKSSQTKKSFNCDFCEYKTEYSNHLKRHLQKVHHKKLYSCEICAASFSIANKYKIHKSYHIIKNSLKIPHSSPISKESFPVFNYLNDHENKFRENSGIIKTSNRYVKKEENQFIAQNLDYYLNLLLRDKKLFKCNICTAMFIDSDRFEDHKTVHVTDTTLQNKKRFSCDFCDYKSNYFYLIKNHILKLHQNLSVYTCQICKTRFKHFIPFLYHKKIHLKNVDYNQKKIQKLTTNQTKHNKTNKVNKNDYSNITTDNNVKKEKSNNVNVLKRINYSIGENYSPKVYKKQKITKSAVGSYLQIDKHEAAEAKSSKSPVNRLEVKQNSFVCNICNSGFQSQALFENHKRYHLTNSGEMPEMSSGRRKKIYCAICLYECDYNYLLRRHMLKHLRLYRCSLCKFASNNRPLLTQHKKTHSNESFLQIKDVTDKRNERVEDLECKSCKIKFNEPDEFLKHVRIHLPVVSTHSSLVPVKNKTNLVKINKTR